jgi:Zn-dependent protease with chaperone function
MEARTGTLVMNSTPIRHLLFALGSLALALSLALATGMATAREGVEVGSTSKLSKLVPADKLEQAAAEQYQQMLQEAAGKKQLAADSDPQVVRLRAISQKIIPHALEWNPRAANWKWEVNLLLSDQINAFCMPGGKIAFYSGILNQLKLTDDEVAMIMGHEVAHALREHARERMGKSMATNSAISIGASLLGLGNVGTSLASMGGQLLTMKFGREDESESDLIGMELAAKAGYDPRAGVSLWQKMGAASKGSPPQFLSTHPSGPSRISNIEANLPKVLPFYEKSKPAGAAVAPAKTKYKRPVASPDNASNSR